MESDRLVFDGSFRRTFSLTVFLLILMFSIGEWVARLEVFQAFLTPPRLGSSHSQLGYKLALLEEKIRMGPVDCIMVGSSTVDVGFDPDSFQESYNRVAGGDIQCFNFGIDASSSISVEALTRILVEDYQPRILIFGTDARDYEVARDDRDTAVVLETPWVKYRQGQFSLEGWLLDHFYLFRYRRHLSRLARFELDGTLWSYTENNYGILSNGYHPNPTIATYINDVPDPADDSYEVIYYTRIFSSYQMLDENVAMLEKIMDYGKARTRVIIVEMPVSDGLYYFFGRGEKDYNQFVSQVDELATRHRVLFWRTEPLDSIPDDGWSDYSHLNVSGARIFSTWLGQQVSGLELSEHSENRLR
jgi:hypothetical protein